MLTLFRAAKHEHVRVQLTNTLLAALSVKTNLMGFADVPTNWDLKTQGMDMSCSNTLRCTKYYISYQYGLHDWSTQ